MHLLRAQLLWHEVDHRIHVVIKNGRLCALTPSGRAQDYLNSVVEHQSFKAQLVFTFFKDLGHRVFAVVEHDVVFILIEVTKPFALRVVVVEETDALFIEPVSVKH